MVDETIKRFGVPNIVYNNAGIEGEGNFMAQLSEEGFDRVNAICPGAIDTPMVARITEEAGGNPQSSARTSFFGRIGRAEEIAKTALFLASDDSSFATGAPFIIDGGWTVS
jgi:NAD(P)-dependent dehydrogenase (short-subunit alcohol dehydrogenase family)